MVDGLPASRADEVLELVGLKDAARRKVRGFSMGMRQRLSLAAALLGDPRVIVLDEPANGLDPEGIRWLRGMLRHLADQGRTVLVSSHQLNEVQEIADRVVILDHGRLVRSGSIEELTAGSDSVVVRTPNPDALRQALAGQPVEVEPGEAGTLRIRGLTTEQVGHLAFVGGVELHELSTHRFDLEDLFFSLTSGDQA
jgi:ABC-2 type transport system ATP-binding protein